MLHAEAADHSPPARLRLTNTFQKLLREHMQVLFFLSFEFPTDDMNSSHTFADWRLNGTAGVNNKLLTLMSLVTILPKA